MKSISKFILSGIIFFAAIASAEEPSALNNEPSAAQQLLQVLKPIKTLQANFIQESYDSNDHLLQKQNGSFKVTEKGEFIWGISKPYEQKIISDGKVLKIFDPDLEQLTIKAIDKKNQVIPLLLFSGESENITRQYKILQTDAPTEKNTFDLIAQDKNSLFDKLQIIFKKGDPDSLSIIDSLKQKTIVHFEKVVINPSFKASTFQFEVPAGVDVIDERQVDERKIDTR